MDDNNTIYLKEECDDYKHTVWALLAFANHSSWDFEEETIDEQAEYSLGKRVTLDNGKEVTPDIVVQKKDNYGLVGEAKKSLPKKENYLNEILEQLIKYYDIKNGWIDDQVIQDYDVIFLTDISNSIEFIDFFNSKDRGMPYKPIVIGFEHTDETSGMYITLKKENGDIKDPDLNQSLRKGTKVKLEHIEETIGEIKFYDSQPPFPYLTKIFWENICGPKISDETWSTEERAHILEFKVEEVTEELQEYYGQISEGKGEQEIPKQNWIKKMFAILDTDKSKYVEKTGYKRYKVYWKRINGDLLEKFIAIYSRNKDEKKKKQKPEQLQFDFPENLNTDE